MGVIVKAENDWGDVGWPQVAMRRNCHIFLVYLLFIILIFIYRFLG